MTRREQREAVLELLFETEFKKDESAEEIFALASLNREFTPEAGSYIKDVYFDLLEKLEEIDAMIGKCTSGWKTQRLSKLSRSIMRLCVYELLYRDDIPTNVSINEAVELSKKFDDTKARAFVNGVLNGVKNLIEAEGKKVLYSGDLGEYSDLDGVLGEHEVDVLIAETGHFAIEHVYEYTKDKKIGKVILKLKIRFSIRAIIPFIFCSLEIVV